VRGRRSDGYKEIRRRAFEEINGSVEDKKP
jgi:hypothetical protein